MTEKNIQDGIQDTLQSMTEFADADVVVNDWSILDRGSTAAPYVIIENSDGFTSTQGTMTGNVSYEIPVTLVEAFSALKGWKTTLDNFLTRRDAIITKYNAVGAARAANGLSAVDIHTIRTDGPPEPWYRGEVDPTMSNPTYYIQRFIFEVDEGWG